MQFDWKKGDLPNAESVDVQHEQITGSGSVIRDDVRGGARWYAVFDHRGAYESEANGEVVFTDHSQEENVEAAKRQAESFLRTAASERDRKGKPDPDQRKLMELLAQAMVEVPDSIVGWITRAHELLSQELKFSTPGKLYIEEISDIITVKWGSATLLCKTRSEILSCLPKETCTSCQGPLPIPPDRYRSVESDGLFCSQACTRDFEARIRSAQRQVCHEG